MPFYPGSNPTQGTVTSIATGQGLTGGPITNSGTVAIATGPTILAQAGTAVAILSNPTLTPPTLSGNSLLKIMNGNSATAITAVGFGSGNSPMLQLAAANGTNSAPTALSLNNGLFQLQGWGYDGATWAQAGQFTIRANGTWTASSHPTYADARVVASGSTVMAVGMRVVGATGGGRVLVNTTTDDGSNVLQVNGSSNTSGTVNAGTIVFNGNTLLAIGSGLTLTSGTLHT